jgi:hypothetical protein
MYNIILTSDRNTVVTSFASKEEAIAFRTSQSTPTDYLIQAPVVEAPAKKSKKSKPDFYTKQAALNKQEAERTAKRLANPIEAAKSDILASIHFMSRNQQPYISYADLTNRLTTYLTVGAITGFAAEVAKTVIEKQSISEKQAFVIAQSFVQTAMFKTW